MNKKIIYIVLSMILIIALTAGCKAEIKKDSETGSIGDNTEVIEKDNETGINGRIIEINDGVHIIIRNEADTSIYYKIDISAGIVFDKGVNENLQPDNVIRAKVEMLDEEALPKETKLISLTGNKPPDYKIINAKQAKEMIDAGNVLIVDVRTRGEFEDGYIPEAYNVPVDMIDKGIKNITENKNDTILVYCRSGNRSKVAARILTELGYRNVYDFGGIVDWPYDIEVP